MRDRQFERIQRYIIGTIANREAVGRQSRSSIEDDGGRGAAAKSEGILLAVQETASLRAWGVQTSIRPTARPPLSAAKNVDSGKQVGFSQMIPA